MSAPPATEPPPTAAERTLESDPIAALDVLRRDLGIPSLPRYSVLLVGGKSLKIDQVLGLLDYGIRLFLVTESRDEELWKSLRHFEQARLLEWECVPEVGDHAVWIVDGIWPANLETWVRKATQAADQRGGLNLQQYQIVHADSEADVLVTAGAGTGKTETMTERLVYLMATVHGHTDAPIRPGSASTPRTMSLDEVGLVTFTREAAKEMRRRIARTVTLRQRLCPRCVHPTVAWLMQLGRAQISTIHMFARKVVQQFGSVLGMGPGFAISSRTLSLQAHIREELAARLHPLFMGAQSAEVPPIHEWIRHVETVWETLENNGVPLLVLGTAGSAAHSIDWGKSPTPSMQADAVRVTGEVIDAVAVRLGAECLREQFLRTSQLVPAALQAVRATDSDSLAVRRKRLRFLFVDEFQDTDAMQLDLLLAIRERLDARLFVVGDAKQGIYRFRGASGNAFEALQARVVERALKRFSQFVLTRNFRSDGRLLDSMHPYFNTWGASDILPYKPNEKLLSRKSAAGIGCELSSPKVGKQSKCLEHAAQLVGKWRAEDPKASIAVLCRRNSQAMKVHRIIKQGGGSCELLVGGTFFISEAVLELRALLEAVLDPANTAALLELCETRWAGAMLADGAPWSEPAAREAWGGRIDPPMHWRDRVASLGASGSFDRSDLTAIQRRVEFLASRLRRMAAVAFIVECHTKLDPSACGCAADDDEEARVVYSRNLDHLITLIDAQFQNSAATADSILAWLRVQIATNRIEDEPAEPRATQGETIALTVHKSKGLEFDRVIVACTDTNFETSDYVTSEAFVTSEGGKTKVWWTWKMGQEGADWRNAPEAEAGWNVDLQETEREETRLLYVAMTRARSRLEVLRPAKAPTFPCWDKLLRSAEAGQ